MGLQAFIQTALAKQGFAVIGVGDPAGSWSYTVGFTDLGHPEIIISGLRQDLCHRFFWDIYDAITKDGKRYADGDLDTDLANLPTVFKTITAESAAEFCCQALYWYEDKGKTPTFLQMVLPDREGRLPWQLDYDAQLMHAQRQLWATTH